MQYRGPILIVFALSLVMSPMAIKLTTDAEEAAVPGRVETMGAADAACDAQTIEARTYVIGCRGREVAVDTRRTVAGGAMFVAARH